MKAAVVLGLLSTICCFSIGVTQSNIVGTAALTRLKSTTQSTTNDLTRYSSNLSWTLSRKLSNLKIDKLMNINGITNPALNDIRSQISSANANGKDAEKCYEPARMRLRAISLSSAKDLDKCSTDGLATIDPVKTNIATAVLTGNRIVNELDAIAISCISANNMQTQNCIVAKIPGASASVKSLQDSANQLKNTGDSTSSNAILAAMTCYAKPEQAVREEALSVRQDATTCINNA